jgi:hypothetical protein
VKLSGYRVGVALLVEMDGIQAWQGISFAVADGKTPIKLRDRVLMTAGAALDAHVNALAKSLDVEIGAFAYRIIDIHDRVRVCEPNGDQFEIADASPNWMMLECLIFGDTDGRGYYGEAPHV